MKMIKFWRVRYVFCLDASPGLYVIMISRQNRKNYIQWSCFLSDGGHHAGTYSAKNIQSSVFTGASQQPSQHQQQAGLPSRSPLGSNFSNDQRGGGGGGVGSNSTALPNPALTSPQSAATANVSSQDSRFHQQSAPNTAKSPQHTTLNSGLARSDAATTSFGGQPGAAAASSQPTKAPLSFSQHPQQHAAVDQFSQASLQQQSQAATMRQQQQQPVQQVGYGSYGLPASAVDNSGSRGYSAFSSQTGAASLNAANTLQKDVIVNPSSGFQAQQQQNTANLNASAPANAAVRSAATGTSVFTGGAAAGGVKPGSTVPAAPLSELSVSSSFFKIRNPRCKIHAPFSPPTSILISETFYGNNTQWLTSTQWI